jgi:DHA2 family multidrug resistance protein
MVQTKALPTQSSEAASPQPSWITKWSIVLTLACGTALGILSSSIVGVAMPRMLSVFSVSMDTLTWVAVVYITAAMLSAGLTGWLSILLGRKRLFILSMLLFAAASLWCGMTQSLEFMLMGRILQGLGAGVSSPIAAAILFSTFSEKEKASVWGVYLVAPLAAGGVGPILGGWLTESLEWRWVFFCLVPLSVATVLLGARFIPSAAQEKRTLGHVDVIGLALLVISLTALEFFLLRGPREGWCESSFIVTMGLVGAVALVLFAWWEWRIDEPVLNLRVLKNISYTSGVSLVLLWGLVFFGCPFLIPIYLQQLRGYSVIDSGFLMLPQALAMVVLTPLVGRLYAYVNPRLLVGVGMGFIILGFLDMGSFTLEVRTMRMLPAFAFTGMGIAFLYTALTTVTMVSVSAPLLGAATSLYGLMRRVGGSIGFALIATQVASRTTVHHAILSNYTTPNAIGLTQTLDDLTNYLMHKGLSLDVAKYYAQYVLNKTVISQSAMLAYSDIFIMLALLFLCGVPLIFLLGRRAHHRES